MLEDEIRKKQVNKESVVPVFFDLGEGTRYDVERRIINKTLQLMF